MNEIELNSTRAGIDGVQKENMEIVVILLSWRLFCSKQIIHNSRLAVQPPISQLSIASNKLTDAKQLRRI
jgi:hypothetical protein